MSIYITQLIYLHDGEEKSFHEFENIAIPIIAKYNGKLLLRVRPTEKEIIVSKTDHPYEIHLVEFATEKDFENFLHDEERKQFTHLKEKSIKTVLLIKGQAL
ncbi:DUF1330 domain-containing protein [Ferruginibacter sp. SUN002]|uniref:DUF1330 domain-containing protein n=1 Tax=Ferruginibacter sp. SUN002 TaxID=2937789 RepID=UPI003D35CA6F